MVTEIVVLITTDEFLGIDVTVGKLLNLITDEDVTVVLNLITDEDDDNLGTARGNAVLISDSLTSVVGICKAAVDV